MIAQRRRIIVLSLGVLVAGWAIALTGYLVAQHFKVTAEKVAAQLRATNLSRLSRADRAKALRDLAELMNALSIDERRRVRSEEEWDRLFVAMNEKEKGEFIEATLPTGFKQMLNAFEEMPEDKRRQAIDRTMKELAKARQELGKPDAGFPARPERADRMGQLSPELQQKVVTIGLKSFYNEGSAQSRAELAPVIEEMQRLMESGALHRHSHR